MLASLLTFYRGFKADHLDHISPKIISTLSVSCMKNILDISQSKEKNLTFSHIHIEWSRKLCNEGKIDIIKRIFQLF